MKASATRSGALARKQIDIVVLHARIIIQNVKTRYGYIIMCVRYNVISTVSHLIKVPLHHFGVQVHFHSLIKCYFSA